MVVKLRPQTNPAPARQRPLISLCLIVKNERANLARCLDSARSVAGEMIVVDTGSTDGTPELARGLGARVIQVAWEENFSRARNLGIANARGSWILVLDADEFLLERDAAAIQALALQHTPAGGVPRVAYTLQNKSSSDGGRTGMVVRLVRFFPNRPDIRFEWPIHEQVATSLQRAGVPIVDSPIEIIHTGYTDPARNQEKQRRNLAILQAQVAAGQEVYPLTYFLIGGAHFDLGEFELALVNYGHCRRLAAKDSELERGAQVRMAGCLVKLGRYEEALADMPADIGGAWHPEMLVLRGETEAALGEIDAARPWFERVLGGVNQAFVPACNLAGVKTKAALFLGSYWRDRGKPALGLAVLREARACHLSGQDFNLARLAGIYREHQV